MFAAHNTSGRARTETKWEIFNIRAKMLRLKHHSHMVNPKGRVWKMKRQLSSKTKETEVKADGNATAEQKWNKQRIIQEEVGVKPDRRA